MGTPSATRMGLTACDGTVGGGGGAPSAWIVPLFQVGSAEDLLTGTAMDSRIKLTESAATRTSRLFFTGHSPCQEGCQFVESLGPRLKKSSVDGTPRQTGIP